MSIESTCPNCHRTLRVGEEHAGKQARCPACETIYTVPAIGAGAPTTDIGSDPLPSSSTEQFPAASTEQWRMKTPEGQTYGPVPKSELDNWVGQGRIARDCQIRREEDNQWQWASDVYPSLAATAVAVANPFAQSSDESRAVGGVSNPYTSPVTTSTHYRSPHRGGLILTLGILSLVICFPLGIPLGIPAWIMGATDLKEMRAGRMDETGLGTTQSGMILGIIACVIMMLILPLFCCAGFG